MFSGIVEGTGRVAAVSGTAGSRRLAVDLGKFAESVAAGDSVAIDGVCLTAVKIDGSQISFDVIAETLKKTTLGSLSEGNRVNIERSLKVGDRNDGHTVQGHVQGVGKIARRIDRDNQFVLWVKLPAGLLQYVAPQGSIAVQGVSLTVAELNDDRFKVALIPTTLERTNLGDLTVGATVNIETDMVARQVVRYLELRDA